MDKRKEAEVENGVHHVGVTNLKIGQKIGWGQAGGSGLGGLDGSGQFWGGWTVGPGFWESSGLSSSVV